METGEMQTLEEIKKSVSAAISARKNDLAEMAQDLWKHPETGFREHRTSALAVKCLQDLGLKVQTPLAVTGFKGVLDSGKPGPGVALFGEMDALDFPGHPACDPVTGAAHACGHHIHLAAMLGAAMGLCDSGAKEFLSGRILFLGSPAEECGELDFRRELIRSGQIRFLGGKQELIRQGALADADIGMMMHVGNIGCVGVDTNGFVKKMVRFVGKSCHAATPWKGINALNAATLAMNALAMLRETFPENSGIRLHGMMTRGGSAVNIIPDDVRLEYQIRAADMRLVREVARRFDRAVRGAALSIGAKAEILTLPGYMPMKNDPALFRLFAREASAYAAGGQGKINIEFNPICTDMGDVSRIMPAIHPYYPGAVGGPHTTEFHVPDPGKTCVEMASIQANLALELLYGDAAVGKSIARAKKHALSTSRYLSMMSRF